MDEEADATDTPDVQESLMGALIGARGVPGGLQGVSVDAPAEGAEKVSGLSKGTAELLGISSETLESVTATAEEPAADEESEVADAAAVEAPVVPVVPVEAQVEVPGEPVDAQVAVPVVPVVPVEAQVEEPAEVQVEEPAEVQVEEPAEAQVVVPTAPVVPLEAQENGVEVDEPEPEPEGLEVEEAELGGVVGPVLEAEPVVAPLVPPSEPKVVEPKLAVDAPEPTAAVSEPDVEAEPLDNIDEPDPDGIGRVVLEWAVVLVGAVVMALVLRQFIFQAFWIPSESMETTLEIRDRVLVNRLSYQWGEVGRGDIVVFARRPEEVGEIRDLIKRVIGLPGESVEGRDNQIYIDGVRLDEPYVDEINRNFGNFGPIAVPDNELFVMGDNRDQSFDSRLFGTVEEERVAGRAFVTFWPLDRIGSL